MADILKIAMRDLHTPFIKLERTRYCLTFIKAKINDAQEVLLMIDTGASSTILTRDTAGRLKLDVSTGLFAGHTIDDAGNFKYRKATLDRLTAGGRTVESFPVLVSERNLYYPSSHYEVYGIKNIDGLLGSDFLRRFIVSFDAANNQVTFGLPGEPVKDDPLQGQSVGFRLLNFMVIVEVEVAKGVKGNFLLDSGAAFTIFSTGITEELKIKESQMVTIPIERARGIGGMFSRIVALKHESVFLDGVEIPTEFVATQNLNYSSVFDGLQIDGLLGGHLLYNFRVTIDYPGRRLWLERAA
ncbi:MAG: retropepsin-like domain-containing protein [Acidobacteria bacterium]|nr:retropepsin-like domain-containing protein [Acidobacteriota bacterium]